MSDVERRPWPSNPRYLAGTDGSVVGPQGHPLKGQPTKDGHLLIGVRVNGKRKTVGAHVVVCETFHGPRSAGMYAAHDNGKPADNRPENLSWKTPVANMADRHRHGTNGRKLTAGQVSEILASEGQPRRVLADRYGVSLGMISHIRTGHAWRVGRGNRVRTQPEESHG